MKPIAPLYHSALVASSPQIVAQAVPGNALVEPSVTDVIAELMAGHLAGTGWCQHENLGLAPEHLAALRAEVDALNRAGKLVQAGIGRGPTQQVATGIRQDRTAWLDGQSQAQAALFRRFGEIQQHLNRSLYLGLTHFEAHFAAFEPGASYRAHRDSFRGQASRMVSLVLYLNEDWGPDEGGELRLLGAGGAIEAEILPQAGRTVCFMSEETLHEVLPAKRLRYSIACWFRVGSHFPASGIVGR